MIDMLSVTAMFVLGCTALTDENIVWAFLFYMCYVAYMSILSKDYVQEYIMYGYDPNCPETVGDADYN